MVHWEEEALAGEAVLRTRELGAEGLRRGTT